MLNKILIVDDEPNNLAVLDSCLNEAGFEVRIANNGKTALKQVNYIKPDIILLDVMMPDMDGFETCSRLKNHEQTKDTPVIFLTARTDTIDKVKGLESSAVDYITKPFQVTEVIARVNKHLAINQLKKQLQEQNAQLQRKAEMIDKYIMISSTDQHGLIKHISSHFTKITGYSADEVIGKRHNILQHTDTPLSVYKNQWQTLLSGKVWEGELKNVDKHGKDFWVRQIITPEFNNKGEIESFTAISEDITDKKLIEHISMTDSLTGLYNRYKPVEVLSSEISRFERCQHNFSVIILDVDFFKQVNDNHGHQVGDNVLIQIATIMQKNTRQIDCVSRWGGEEFLIIVCESDLNSAFVFAEKLRITIQNHTFPMVEKITISCGVAQYLKGETTSGLVSRADKALYSAKKTGRNRVIKG